MNDLESKLLQKGWVKNQSGEWCAPSRRPVGGLQDPKPQHREIQTLAGGPSKQANGTGGVAYRCCIISFRKRILDSDNLTGGCKSLRDSIARSLGVDDSERYIEWTYEQIVSKTEGTLVLLTEF